MNVKMTLRRNSPKLLAILAAMGTVSTAFATARATPKALLLIREAESQKGEDLTALEKVKVAAVTWFGYYCVYIWSTNAESKGSVVYDQRVCFIGSEL